MAESKIPPIEDEEIVDEVKKPVDNNTKEEAVLEKADRPSDLWESFLERRKGAPVQVGVGSGDARFGNPHETGMEQDPVDDKQTYIGKPAKESNEDDK